MHNAGITRDKLLANMDAARWDSVIAVNIASQLGMNQAFLAAAGDGGVRRAADRLAGVHVGHRGQPRPDQLRGVQGRGHRHGPATAPLLTGGGTINAVAPGFIETEMTARIPAVTREVARRLNSLQQGGQPVDVAEAVAFLVSDAAGGTSGATLRVCGQGIMGA